MNRLPTTMVTALLLAAAGTFAQPGEYEQGDEPTAAQRRLSPDAIDMPPSLRQLLGDVSDDGQWFQKGLMALLNHVDDRPQLSQDQIAALENPSFAKLLAAPDLYRGQAVRVSFVPRIVDPIKPSSQFPADEKFWLLRGNVYRDELKGDQPIMVVSSADPGPLLGEPDRVDPDGAWVYEKRASLRPVETVAVLFSIARGPGQDVLSGGEVDAARFPVMVTWQVRPAAGQEGPASYQLPVAVVGVLVMCLGLFYVARRYLKQVKQRRSAETPVQRYRKQRELQRADRDDEHRDLPVSEDLVDAARRYRQERDHE